MAGWVLGQAGLKTATRKGLVALILGANMPDIDVFFWQSPWDPLAIHRGFTHGLVGGVVPGMDAARQCYYGAYGCQRGLTYLRGGFSAQREEGFVASLHAARLPAGQNEAYGLGGGHSTCECDRTR